MKQEYGLEDFFAFRKLISVGLIRGVYVLGMIGISISGILAIIGSIEARRGFFGDGTVMWGGILWGLAVLIFGNLLWRIFCEGLILLFNLHEVLVSIKTRVEGFHFPDLYGSVRQPLESVAEEFKKGVYMLSSLEKEIKEGISHEELREAFASTAQQLEGSSTRLAAIEERLTGRLKDSQGLEAPQTSQEEPQLREERPKPLRRRLAWIVLALFLVIIGSFVGIPIAAGYSKIQGLEPQALSSFIANIWGYWVQVVEGLGG